MKRWMVIAGVLTLCTVYTTVASAGIIPYRRSVSLKVGQSIILKGVRGGCNDRRAPSFSRLNRLPRPRTGRLSDGGAGKVRSTSCNKIVPARAIRFTATKKGKERITIYRDRISITVK